MLSPTILNPFHSGLQGMSGSGAASGVHCSSDDSVDISESTSVSPPVPSVKSPRSGLVPALLLSADSFSDIGL